MNSYIVKWSNGTEQRWCETYEAAKALVLESYPDAAIGHDGDISEGGDRTLCWAAEKDSIDDDGARAICSIWRDRAALRGAGHLQVHRGRGLSALTARHRD